MIATWEEVLSGKMEIVKYVKFIIYQNMIYSNVYFLFA